LAVIGRDNATTMSYRKVVWYVEMTCDVFFVAQYALLLRAFGLRSALKVERIIDFLCLLPAIGFALLDEHLPNENAEAGAYLHTDLTWKYWLTFFIRFAILCRVIRILDFPWMRSHFGLLLHVLREAGGNLMIPIFLWFYVWIFSSCVFCWVETYFDGMAQNELNSIPSAMYWCSIFLVGEWSITDFSSGGGSRLCIVYSVLAVMVYAVSVGVISEAMQCALLQNQEQQVKIEDLKKTRERLERYLTGNPKRARMMESQYAKWGVEAPLSDSDVEVLKVGRHSEKVADASDSDDPEVPVTAGEFIQDLF